VITIIGILIALLLPAVQAAREAARQAQCKNNLKQLALGCMTHENLHGRFPTGGWGFAWTGDANRGTDWRQPGGWIYNVLPFVEQQSLYDMGADRPGPGDDMNSQKSLANRQRLYVALGVLYCPSRRSAIAIFWNTSSGAWGEGLRNAGLPALPVGRNDYAANGGDYYTTTGYPDGPAWTPAVNNDGGPLNFAQVETATGQMTAAARETFGNVAKRATGIVYAGSMVRLSDVTDGASLTYLVGEKFICTDYYLTGYDQGDNEASLIGENADITRFTAWNGIPPVNNSPTYCRPWPDTPGLTGDIYSRAFGSAHLNGFHIAFCDGSVQMVNFSIEPNVHGRLGNRKDGLLLDGKKF